VPGRSTLIRRPVLLTAAALAAAVALSACGTEDVSVSKDDPTHAGAVLFSERCAGCHTLAAAGTQGTSNRSVRTEGPNLDGRPETYDDVIFAIRNGGFSGGIMPQNIVTGDEARQVAEFVAKYAGSEGG
jgi:mono/diheme cytochrome c family protein